MFFRPFIKYFLVGCVSTGIHFICLYFLVEKVLISSEISNVCAFLVANIFSYYLNSVWSFQFSVSKVRYLKFFIVSAIGVVFSYSIMKVCSLLEWHYMIAFCIQVLVMPLINFLLIRLFVFPQKTSQNEQG
ncbi:MAG: GtrA family protein [Puniceicoccales bacterium]|nr:GtrA family protein [Puniceicoccales bacterium]